MALQSVWFFTGLPSDIINSLEKDLEKLIATMERIDEKLDRLQTKTYFQD